MRMDYLRLQQQVCNAIAKRDATSKSAGREMLSCVQPTSVMVSSHVLKSQMVFNGAHFIYNSLHVTKISLLSHYVSVFGGKITGQTLHYRVALKLDLGSTESAQKWWTLIGDGFAAKCIRSARHKRESSRRVDCIHENDKNVNGANGKRLLICVYGADGIFGRIMKHIRQYSPCKKHV